MCIGGSSPSINIPPPPPVTEDVQGKAIRKREREIANRKITGKYILKALMEYQTWYGIHILFCDNAKNAQKVTESIFKRLNTMFHEQT